MATESREGVETRVIPGSNKLFLDEFVDFPFGKNGATDVQATVSGRLHYSLSMNGRARIRTLFALVCKRPVRY